MADIAATKDITVTPEELRALYQERVTDGISWMDENVPGWEPHIEIETLHLSSGEHCIVGQTERGTHVAVRDMLAVSEYDRGYPPELGFEIADEDVDGWEIRLYYRLLDDVWTEAILARRAERQHAP
jgi:hypothetical protein